MAVRDVPTIKQLSNNIIIIICKTESNLRPTEEVGGTVSQLDREFCGSPIPEFCAKNYTKEESLRCIIISQEAGENNNNNNIQERGLWSSWPKSLFKGDINDTGWDITMQAHPQSP